MQMQEENVILRGFDPQKPEKNNHAKTQCDEAVEDDWKERAARRKHKMPD